MEKKYLIIPDVHGRTFWKVPVEKWLENTNNPIVFLGDYVDPYSYEGISRRDAIDVFKDILVLKSKYPDRIRLLIGNHDWQYIDWMGDGSRIDYANREEISNLFLENASFFKFAHFDNVGGRNVIFSHAGINPSWIFHDYDVFFKGDSGGIKDDKTVYSTITFDSLREFFDNGGIDDFRTNEDICKSLLRCSSFRMGTDSASSILWCDVHEMILESYRIDAVQIFGHTQTESNPIRSLDCYDLDCRRHFYLTDDCKVVDSITDECVPDNGEDERKEYLKRLEAQMHFFL